MTASYHQLGRTHCWNYDDSSVVVIRYTAGSDESYWFVAIASFYTPGGGLTERTFDCDTVLQAWRAGTAWVRDQRDISKNPTPF